MPETITPPGVAQEAIREGPVLKQDIKLPNPARVLALSPEHVAPSGKEIGPFPNGMEDEFNGIPRTIVRPDLQNLIMPDGKVDQAPEMARVLNRDFAILSATRDLETDTPRANAIQEAVNRMTVGMDVKTKVVIMNKGAALEAFTYPDGTIFVSQSLINTLDTMDQLMAVLGHEVSHVVLKTAYKKAQAGEGHRQGVGWVHESACDTNSLNLLERGRYNTLAFSQAIEKISGYERGTIHQGGLARASQSVLTHYLVDSSTNHLPQIPLPQEFKGQVRKTNREILRENDKVSKEEFYNALTLLYPGDLEEAYGRYFKIASNDWSKQDKVTVIKNLLYDRLTEAGYSKGEALLSVIGFGDSYGFGEIPNLKTVSDFEEITKSLDVMERYSKRYEICQKLFLMPKSVFNNPLDTLLEWLPHDIRPGIEGRAIGRVPVDEQSLLNFIKTVQSLSVVPGAGFRDSESKGKRIIKTTNLLKAYINNFLDRADLPAEEMMQKATEFLEKAKAAGIKVDMQELLGKYPSIKNFDIDKDARINSEFQRVFNIEVKKEPGFEDIDKCFDAIEGFRSLESNSQNATNEVATLQTLFHKVQGYFEEKGIQDSERVKLVEYALQKIEGIKFQSNFDVLSYLNGDYPPKGLGSEKMSPEAEKLQDALIKFRLKSVVALSLFQYDGPEFYKTMQDIMDKSGIDPSALNQVQLINLCEGLMGGNWLGTREKMIYTNFDARSAGNMGFHDVTISHPGEVAKLPFVEAALKKENDLSGITDIKGLVEYIEELSKKINITRTITEHGVGGDKFNLFGDGLLPLMLSKDLLGKFDQLMQQGIPENEFPDLNKFIEYYPDGNNKSQFEREINLRYLRSQDVDLNSKIHYLSFHLNTIGPEGMVIVAEEIEDIGTYRKFRDRMGKSLSEYLDGSNLTSALALGDLLTSQVTQNWRSLLSSSNTDPEVSARVSTSFATEWVQNIDKAGRHSKDVKYEAKEKKFAISDLARKAFRSISDSFGALKGLTRVQRLAVAHKALTEHNGAFSSEENRRSLAGLFLDSLKIKDKFISSVIYTGILKGDAKFIVAPVADMIGGKLFEGLKTESIDLDKVGGSVLEQTFMDGKKVSDKYSREELAGFSKLDTRGLTIFGPNYEQGSLVSQLAKVSDERYYSTTNYFRETLGLNRKEEVAESEARVDPALETLIRGVEASGPLGIRSLQLAVQFFSFPPEVHKRLSESFDKNPGMNKLVFWSNLDKLAQDELAGRNDSETPNSRVEEFLKRIKLGVYLGGGSLQTTFSADYKEDNGEVKQVIVKRKNPSIVSFIKDAHDNATLVLNEIAEKGASSEEREKARVGLMLVDLAQKWCIDDINDKTYEKDDDLFIQTISNYNKSIGFDSVYAPKRVFTESKVKSEEMASGRTANQLLNDPTVDNGTKRDVVESMSELFLFQMRKQAFVDENGQKFYLVHSDPHVGNIMVDTSGEDLKLGVIDRSMFLKLSERESGIMDLLVKDQTGVRFLTSFVDYILDSNNIRGKKRRQLGQSVLLSVGKEFGTQLLHRRINKFSLLQTALTEFNKSKIDSIDVPLRMRLMLRNIAAFQELNKRHGTDFEEMNRSLDFAA